MTIGMTFYDKPSQVAFERAIENGRLSQDQEAANFAGNYMYMGTSWAIGALGRDEFKHVGTRRYLA